MNMKKFIAEEKLDAIIDFNIVTGLNFEKNLDEVLDRSNLKKFNKKAHRDYFLMRYRERKAQRLIELTDFS
jgi:hypothetical protein